VASTADGRSAAARVERLLAAARRLRDAADPLGARLRARLVAPVGLHPKAIELALERSLEAEPDPRELGVLIAGVEPALRAHVILPSNVFVAAHRALALALASSADVRVKPSRREPVFVELLAEAAPGLFEIVPAAGEYPWSEVRRGDHVWAYASDQTLSALSSALPAGAVLHAHGPGFGVAVLALDDRTRWAEHARALALDTALFEQRGCLSPRLVLARGTLADAEAFAEILASAFAAVADECPPGRLEPAEQAASAWFRQRSLALGRLFEGGRAAVAVHGAASLLAALPPSGRNLLLVPLTDGELVSALVELEPHVTIAGCSSPELAHGVARALPRARIAPLGRMQSPPFDGPADRRNR
jgi:acyl-CoA reductase LuxC